MDLSINCLGKSVRILRRFVFLITLLSGVILSEAGKAAASDFVLGAGDRIKLSIMGVPSSDVEAVIALDNSLNLVWLGRVDTEGKTIAELTEEVRELARDKVIKRYSADGTLSLIQISADDVFLEISEYRPVVVSGDVAAPGELAFRPGLTARRAIAQAGGTRSAFLADVLANDPVQIVRWQNDYARAALENAISIVRLWRISAEIDDNPVAPPPQAEQVAVDSDVLANLIAEQKRILRLNRQNEAGDRTYLKEALEKASSRIAIMEQQQEKAMELLAADEAEESRIKELLERGLTPAARLADIRRTTVLSATQLLDIEEKLASATLEVTRLRRELEQYEEIRLADLFTSREQTYNSVLDTRLRMDLNAQNLSGASAAFEGWDNGVSVAVLRRLTGQIQPVQIDLDDALHPGDTLVVTLAQPTKFAPAAD